MGVSFCRFLALAGLAGACGGGAGQGEGASPGSGAKKAETFPPRTEAVLVGPLCQGESCRCREGDGDAGPAPAGSKRFEVRLGPSPDLLWATVDGMVMHKSAGRQEACFYVDLRAGKHEVSFRGLKDEREEGLGASIAIAEQGGAEDATWWYRTFDFQCGAPGLCDRAAIEAWNRDVSRLAGKHDPCGSTKVQGIRWETGRGADREHVGELLLHLTLDIYKFDPEHPPGSNECDQASTEAAPE
jgi:hypothetical protein